MKKRKITPAAPKDIRELKRTIQRFKDTVNEHRDDIWYEPEGYLEVKNDDLYRNLETESDLTKGDVDLDLRANIFQRYFDEEEQQKKTALPAAKTLPREEADQVIPIISGDDVNEQERAMYLGDEIIGETDSGSLELTEDLTKKYQQFKGNALAESRNAKKPPTIEARSREILEKYRKDFELQLGGGFLNKIGLLFLVIGVIWLVNYGIDEGFINQWGQVLITLAAAGGLLTLAHFQRKSRFLSATTAGVGIALAYYAGLLYFDFFLARDGYIPFGEQVIAFTINLLITSVAVVQALSYQRRTMAIFGMLGGYLMPAFVSVDETSNYLFFGYLLLINIGFLVVSFRKQWSTINLMTFTASLIIFGSWSISHDMNIGDNASVALIFGTLYYLTFLVMNVVHSLRGGQNLEAINFILLIINTVFYFLTTIKVLIQIDADPFYFSFFAFGLTAFNYLYAYVLYKNNSEDFKLLNTVIFISVLSATAAAPLLLEGADLLSLLWSVEAVVLAYLGLRIGLNILKSLSLVMLFLSLIAMLVQWYISYTHAWVQFLENTAVLTALAMMAAVLLIWGAVRRHDAEEHFGLLRIDVFRDVLMVLFLTILLLIVNLELIIHSTSNFGSVHLRNILINGWHILFVVVLWQLRRFLGLPNMERSVLVFFVVVIMSYFALVLPSTISLREAYVRGLEYAARGILVSQENALRDFLLHYLNLAALLTGLVVAVRVAYRMQGKDSVAFSTLTYMASVLFFIQISIEYWHVFDLLQYHLPPEVYDSRRKVGFILVWLLTFLSFILLGIQTHTKELRLMSLFVFAFTLSKFLLVDFWLMSTLGRIISFLVIGGITIIVSLLYNQLREVIIRGELEALTPPDQEDN